MMTRKILLTALSFGITIASFSQDKWDLQRCVEYALQNNISVKQADVQARLAALTLKQSKLSQYPSLGFSGNAGYSSGRNQDPTNFSLITQGFVTSSYTLQSSVDLFNWFSKKNTVAADHYMALADKTNVDKIKNDIALNVAYDYLQVLLNREQVRISEVQVQQSKAQMDNTMQLVEAGSLPELNAAEVETQLAKDSSTLVTAQSTVSQSLLALKALLNLDAAAPFAIDTPSIDKIPVESLGDLQPDAVYALALANLPQQRVNDFRIKSAQKSVLAAKGAMYPTFSMFGSLGSSTNNKATQVTGSTTINPPIGKVTVGSTDYSVYPLSPYTSYTYGDIGYFDQLNQNFRQSIGIGLSIPILNGGSLRSGYERSRLNLHSAELQRDLDNQTLKQDIYKAYEDAVAALEKYTATQKAVASAQKAYDFATKRYNVGLLNTIDLLTNQNNFFSARIDMVLAHYDYVFKLKVLEFYKGQGIRLQ